MRRAFALTALLLATAATAQNSAPQPLPFDNRVPAPRDTAYPGTIDPRARLAVHPVGRLVEHRLEAPAERHHRAQQPFERGSGGAGGIDHSGGKAG